MTRKRIAIIGGGLSGVALAAQLARRQPRPRIVLIERSRRFGRGLAYGAADRAHLLNVRAANMSLFADAPDHFAAWAKARAGLDADGFAPRKLYGAYVEHVLRRSGGRFGEVIARVRGEAVACMGADGAWRIGLGDGRGIEADAVVLALGHPRAQRFGVFEDAGVRLLDPWDAKALRRSPRGDVLLLGAGLTMVDVALSLAARRDGVIYALSRRGLTPRAHREPPPPRHTEPIDLPLPLSEAVRGFRAAADAAARGAPWQATFDRLRPQTTALWRRLPLEAQQRFLRHLRPWWDVHRHRMAPQVARQVDALKQAGRLRVLAGELASAAESARGVSVQYRLRGGRARHRVEAAAVVNCAGADMDITRSADPLLRQLLGDGLARPHPNGLGFDLDEHSRLVGAGGQAHETLYAIGPLTQGAFWESTAVPDIRVWAARIAERLG